ncbi:MAG: hypothetical protein ABIP64_19420 [Burkholderiales bacterium]
MSSKTIPQRTFRVYRRADGGYVTRNEAPADSPLGVDYSLSQALGTARREATKASRDGCRVSIELQDSGGKWRQIDVIDPPRA